MNSQVTHELPVNQNVLSGSIPQEKKRTWISTNSLEANSANPEVCNVININIKQILQTESRHFPTQHIKCMNLTKEQANT